MSSRSRVCETWQLLTDHVPSRWALFSFLVQRSLPLPVLRMLELKKGRHLKLRFCNHLLTTSSRAARKICTNYPSCHKLHHQDHKVSHITPVPWYGHHRRHTHNGITRRVIITPRGCCNVWHLTFLGYSYPWSEFEWAVWRWEKKINCCDSRRLGR